MTEGNAAQTAADIVASEGLFRLGITSLIGVIDLSVVIAWALFRVFSPVNKGLSMLAAVLRLVYSGVYMVAIAQLVGVIRVLGVLLAIAGLGYAIDSIGAVLSHGAWTDFSSFTFIGEFLLALWLLIRARSISVSAPGA